jgi:alcohol dehydrogenase class IV
MQFGYYMPTRIFFGPNCVIQNQAEFAKWGKRALIVTGRNSARVSGALLDVCAALDQQNIAWKIFDQIGENPTFAMVEAGGATGREFKPDMVVAIGGGSPLDAAKAIAVLAVNDFAAARLYDGEYAVEPLPILAIPITAGTGSEVTQYSVLTDVERQTKRGFAQFSLFAKAAFLDARYTQSLSPAVTIDTAVDALSHCVEGYLAKRATVVSDALAIEAIRRFGEIRQELDKPEISLAVREALLYVSMLGGMVIAQTSTTTVHALGYSLTYFHQVPHGRANGLLMGEYLQFHAEAATEKIACLLAAMQMQSIDEFKQWLDNLFPGKTCLTDLQVEEYAVLATKTANVANTLRQPNHAELKELLRKSLIVGGEV